jgi:hypothetical protein
MAKPIKYQRTWVSTANPSQDSLGGEAEVSSGRGGCLPPAVLRKIAKNSSSGGRATCFVCHETFAMYFIKLCKVAPFRQEHVCQDCRGQHKEFQVIR